MKEKIQQILKVKLVKWILGSVIAFGIAAWFIIENPDLPPAIWVTEFQAESGDIDAQNKLALYYYYGDYGEGDISEGLKWYKRAAEAGSTEAMMSLALHYSNGINAPQNRAEEFRWRLKAAEAGDAIAMAYVGMYLEDNNDEEQATHWYLKSAMLGEPVSAAMLGRLAKRYGDYSNSYIWFSIAVSNSNNSVLRHSSGYETERSEVSDRLTTEERAKAQQKASELYDQILDKL